MFVVQGLKCGILPRGYAFYKSPIQRKATPRTGKVYLKCYTQKPQKPGLFQKLVKWTSKENITVTPNSEYTRWYSVASSFLVQISIGSVYAWSIFVNPLSREIGVVTAAAGDWTLLQIIPIFSICAASLGVTTSLFGPWAERAGPRAAALASGLLYSIGLFLSGVGTYYHSLPLLYLGYGVFAGMGWGFGYISPVSTLMKWFPDRRGLATGLALTAFGGGAMIAAPLYEFLFNYFFVLPTYLGDVSLVTQEGIRYAMVGDHLQEVVVASANDVASFGGVELQEGAYLAGTGNTGTAKTFFALSAFYFTTIVSGSALQCIPVEGWKPPHQKLTTSNMAASKQSVHYNEALKTPQFYLIWLTIFGNGLAGVTIISSAKTMMTEIFGPIFPTLVYGGLSATFVASLSFGNMMGRLGWSYLSDFTGRKNAYYIFGSGLLVTMGFPVLFEMVAHNPSVYVLIPFSLGSMLLMSFYGGNFSVLPAFLADVFGPKNPGAIHGRMLTAWSAAALVGPFTLSYLRNESYKEAVTKLAHLCDPHKFELTFGAPLSELQTLLEAKTVTIIKLMEIAPPGTINPTPTLYNTTMHVASGILMLAMVSCMFIKPVHPKHYIKEEQDPKETNPKNIAN